MPEITPELIRKHFYVPDVESGKEQRFTAEAVVAFLHGRLWVWELSQLRFVSRRELTVAVESIILRLDAAEERIEELEAELVQLKTQAIRELDDGTGFDE